MESLRKTSNILFGRTRFPCCEEDWNGGGGGGGTKPLVELEEIREIAANCSLEEWELEEPERFDTLST